MSRIQYIDRKFNKGSLAIIELANAICQEYASQGFTLTLRQIYYQFVARGHMANKQTEYKRLGSILNDARLAGLLDWRYMEDRTRFLRRLSTWENPESIIDGAAFGYKTDWWAQQPYYVEVWIEKDALVGVIEPICDEFRVPYIACRGYMSQSEQHNAAMRYARKIRAGQQIVVLHLGDHDPSGIDMTRDNRERVEDFLANTVDPANFEVRRLALNMDQVNQYNPPPNPAKMTDSRSEDYVEKFGISSWELDALDPTTIGSLIQAEIEDLIDRPAWNTSRSGEEYDRETLTWIKDNYATVEGLANEDLGR